MLQVKYFRWHKSALSATACWSVSISRRRCDTDAVITAIDAADGSNAASTHAHPSCGAGIVVTRSSLEMAERCGAGTALLDWRDRLVWSHCGNRQIDMVVTGTQRRT
jgi:hypothetical protein